LERVFFRYRSSFFAGVVQEVVALSEDLLSRMYVDEIYSFQDFRGIADGIEVLHQREMERIDFR